MSTRSAPTAPPATTRTPARWPTPCNTGSCSGQSKNCDDQNPCTIDTYDPSVGCVHTPLVGAPCDDGRVCTGPDACDQAGACVGQPFAPGSACDDGNLCTANDTCEAGLCIAGEPVVCPAYDACHIAGTCDPTTGVCSGKIIKGKMVLNEFGKIVEKEWLRTKEIRNNVDLDYYVIMPNHMHGNIIINSRGELNSPQEMNLQQELNPNRNNESGPIQCAPTNDKFKSPSQSLGAIIRGFKSAVTKRIREFTGDPELKIWQRNYYEHIIRNELDLQNIRNYIELNPLKWELDEYYKL